MILWFLCFPAEKLSCFNSLGKWIKSPFNPNCCLQIASCSDDHTVRIWRLHREMDGAQSSVGEANLVGWARPKSLLSKHYNYHEPPFHKIYNVF